MPNRPQRRRWEEAQATVETHECRLAEQQEALTNLYPKLIRLRQAYRQERKALQEESQAQRIELVRRQQAGQTCRRCEQRLHNWQKQLAGLTARFQRRRRLLEEMAQRRARRSELL